MPYALGMDIQDLSSRIAQWENMTQADPQNAMGWFSLANAYKEADRLADAAAALQQALDLDPGLSRAYQLLGQVLLKIEKLDQAKDVLTKGYTVAAKRGDVMPQRAIASLMELHRWPLPEVAAPQVAQPTTTSGGDQVIDRRTGQPGQRLPDPPMRGPLGQFIFHHYSQDTWRQWIRMGTKVINELRLDFSNPDHQQLYEQHMKEWLGISDEDVAAFKP